MNVGSVLQTAETLKHSLTLSVQHCALSLVQTTWSEFGEATNTQLNIVLMSH